jgi:hypothetical protein
VGGIVSEDIDYYRLGNVFPGLPQGRPQAGFVLLGDQSTYSVPGGKRVFLYELAGTHDRATLLRGVAVAVPSAAAGTGKSAPLAKGPALLVDGASVAGEGVGFGVPAVHDGQGWHYAHSAQTVDISAPGQIAWRRTYELDLASGDAERWSPLRSAPSRGRITVTYRVSGSSLKVAVSPLEMAAGWDQLVILNEESSRFSDLADASRTGSGDFGPWQPVHGDWARLRDPSSGAEWELAAPPPGAGFLAGRESQPPDLDWAGIEYRFGPTFEGFSYDVNVRRSG